MANTEHLSSWEIIQQGVRDTERLLGQKQYNLSMVKARQTLEYMVKLLGEKACIVNGDLIDIIDALYQGRWITKSTCEHYHKIRMIGNKASHEGSDNAYDANQAYHMLSQEVYTFANEYSSKRKSSASRSTSRSGSRTSSSSSRSGTSSRSASSSRSGSARNATAATRSRKKSPNKGGFVITPFDLLRLLIPVLIVILLVALIKFFKPANDDNETATEPSVTTETPFETTPQETVPPQETPAPLVHKADANLNVRSVPSTDNNDPVGRIPKGDTVEFVRIHEEDPSWTVIIYDGQERYVSSEYLKTE